MKTVILSILICIPSCSYAQKKKGDNLTIEYSKEYCCYVVRSPQVIDWIEFMPVRIKTRKHNMSFGNGVKRRVGHTFFVIPNKLIESKVTRITIKIGTFFVVHDFEKF